ncbi:MAG: beta-hexosaminidase, partial [Clostridia bacterium]|nr:beta-hexosaminidase [Clostridia bacterium]
MRSIKYTAVLLSLLLLLCGCGTGHESVPAAAPVPTPAPTLEPTPLPTPTPTPAPSKEELLLSEMTLEEKVAQLFFVRCPDTDAESMIAELQPGGLLLFGRDFA